jgi:DNA-binding response OmpR family regulator
MKDKRLKLFKVILVEDEIEIAKLLKTAIGDSFRSFLIASDGLEGFDMFTQTSPDIIITDIMMPNSSGLEMAKKIRAINKNIPIIILSAFSEKDKLFKAIDVGVNKYFTKPYNPKDILEYISSIADELSQKIVKLSNSYSFNKNTSSLYKDTKFINLSKKEIEFVKLLLSKEDYLVDYDSVKKSLWGEFVSDDRLRTFIKRFREKTSKDIVKTIKGIGFKLISSEK